jgi:hypothetical protein
MIRSLLRSPALRIAVLGTVVFFGARWRAAPVSPVDRSDDALLLREAFALGVDRSDRAVRDRLAKLARFDGEDPRDAVELEAEARRLGLDRSDVVARRHLVQMMQLAAGRLEPEDWPSEAELRAWMATHAADVTTPVRVRFAQVFVARARPDATTEAARLLHELGDRGVSPDDARAHGDASLGGAEVGPASASELDRRFGPGFAAAIAAAPSGTWAGPVASSYGLHLVWVRERTPAVVPSLEAVRGRVLHRWLRERRDERVRARMAALRARHG